MRTANITRTQFKVSDFLGWQRDKSLVLSPSFQRRPVWKAPAKSYFIDTVVRALPAPIIYIRERLDLETQTTIREVVDGQQRLRTLISFIDPSALPDFDPKRDLFTVRKNHNPLMAGKRFPALTKDDKAHILGYEFHTHVFPTTVEDRDILQIFARLNATGVRLNAQELRNAKFYGVFKALMYELAYEQLERWREWRIFSEDQIARMDEVELTSDLAVNILQGLSGKSQARINRAYERYDEGYDGAQELSRRYRRVMDAIDQVIGRHLLDTVFRREVSFFTLFVFVYDRLYGLGSSLQRTEAGNIPSNLTECLLRASSNMRSGSAPPEVLDAIGRASADIGRRRTRLRYLRDVCDGQAH
jgi:hypothetical protein